MCGQEIEDDTPAAADADMHADLEELERFKAEAAAYVPSADEEVMTVPMQATQLLYHLLAPIITDHNFPLSTSPLPL